MRHYGIQGYVEAHHDKRQELLPPDYIDICFPVYNAGSKQPSGTDCGEFDFRVIS